MRRFYRVALSTYIYFSLPFLPDSHFRWGVMERKIYSQTA